MVRSGLALLSCRRSRSTGLALARARVIPAPVRTRIGMDRFAAAVCCGRSAVPPEKLTLGFRPVGRKLTPEFRSSLNLVRPVGFPPRGPSSGYANCVGTARCCIPGSGARGGRRWCQRRVYRGHLGSRRVGGSLTPPSPAPGLSGLRFCFPPSRPVCVVGGGIPRGSPPV